MPSSWPTEEIEHVLIELMEIRDEMIELAAQAEPSLKELHPNYQESARNLLHYLALRRRDCPYMQRRLASLGFSSLGQAESHVLATIETVLQTLHQLVGRTWNLSSPDRLDFATGERFLAEHTETLLGAVPGERDVRMMVTMPSEAAERYQFIHDLLQHGMACMRINCAHDPEANHCSSILLISAQ